MMFEEFKDCTYLAFDIETYAESGKKKDAVHFMRNSIRCIALSDGKHTECYSFDPLDKNELANLLNTKKLIAQNGKFDLKCLMKNGVMVNPDNLYFDTLIASQLINENIPHDLESSVVTYLHRKCWKFDYKEEHSFMEWCTLCENDTLNTYELAMELAKKLEAQKLESLFNTEMEVVRVFTKSEFRGVSVDVDMLNIILNYYQRKVDFLGKCIFDKVRTAIVENAVVLENPAIMQETGVFNINSSAQLGCILFDLMNMPIISKSEKTGAPSTSVKALTALHRKGYRFVDWILCYRHWEMLNRHCKKLLKEQINGRIYPTFNTCGTETGRFSCKEPNLQQIPAHSRLRKVFTGDMIVADYSNVELRILAHYSRDPKLLDVYSHDGDLHQVTADLLHVTRPVAKTINFGIGYGMGPGLLSEKLGIDKELAASYIKQWYATYKQVDVWKKNIVETCKRYGFVRSIGGRKRRVRLNGLSKYDMFGAEREIINFVIQGSSADVTKLATEKLKDADICMQIHDELVIYNNDADRVKELMEEVGRDLKVRVPLTVDSHHVTNWFDGK